MRVFWEKVGCADVSGVLHDAYHRPGGGFAGVLAWVQFVLLSGQVQLAGEIEHTLRPLAAMHGAGHVTVGNGQLPSLKLNANLMKLAHFNDLGPAKNDPSAFNLMTTDLELDALMS